MIRIATTVLESFRRLIETEYQKEDQLIAQIKGVPFKPTWQMQAGTAWHRALEGQPPDGIPGTLPDHLVSGTMHRWGRFWFSDASVEAARAFIGPGTRELKATASWMIMGHAVTVVAKADHLSGLLIQDNKTTFSPPDPKHYEPSLQWRFYLQIFGCECFRYNIWYFREPDGGGYCELKEIVPIRFWPYAEMGVDCREWVQRFVAWADGKGLLPYLDREGTGVDLEAIT